MMNLIPMLDRWVLISGTVVVWGTFLAYLMTLRKYFIAEAMELQGVFEKPLYIRFEESLCAHSRASRPGCDGCLTVCPTGAITAERFLLHAERHEGVGGLPVGTAGRLLADRALSRLLKKDWPRTLEELEAKRTDAFGQLHGLIQSMREGQEQVRREAQRLGNSLTNAPKARGREQQRGDRADDLPAQAVAECSQAICELHRGFAKRFEGDRTVLLVANLQFERLDSRLAFAHFVLGLRQRVFRFEKLLIRRGPLDFEQASAEPLLMELLLSGERLFRIRFFQITRFLGYPQARRGSME